MKRMARKLLLALPILILFAAAGAHAQCTYTSVSATITDANTVPYSFANVTADLVPAPPGGATCSDGSSFNGHIGPIQTSSAGAFTMLLPANGTITPGSTQWKLTIQETGVPFPFGTGPHSFTYSFTASGSTQSLTSALSSAAPALTLAFGGSGTPAFSAITSGTNTTAAMIVGTGSSLTYSGSGSINASALGSVAISGAASAGLCPVATSPTAGSWLICGANVNLSNLSSVAVNTPLIPGSDNSISIDSTASRYVNFWASGIFGFTNGSGTTDTSLDRGAAGVVCAGVSTTVPDCTGTLEAATVETTNDGVHPGQIILPGNTTLPTLGANTVTILGAPAATQTSYSIQVPTAIIANGHLLTCTTSGTNCLLTDGGAPGAGSVTSVATSSPLGGGPITGTGTLTCATCVTSAASLTSTAIMTGAGTQASQTPSATATLSSGGALSLPSSATATSFISNGSGAGAFVATQGAAQGHATANTVTLEAPAAVTAYEITLPAAAATGIPLWTNTSNVVAETISATVPVAQGGTALASGTSGGILCYTASGTLASSAALTANILTKGGGAGVCPTNSLVTDNGTSATYTGTGGYIAPKLTSNVATGTAPLVITSTTTVPNLTVSNHPKVQFCGTTSTCSATAEVSGQVVYGSAALVSGTPSTVTIASISPAFTATADYVCTVSGPGSTATTNLYGVTNVSASSFTITGPATVTTVVSYVCAGF